MTDYNAEEIARMQKEAKQRVFEMKNRSREYMSGIRQPVDSLNMKTESENNCKENADETEEHSSDGSKRKNETTEPDDQDKSQMETLFLLCLFLLLKEENTDSLMSLLVLSLI